MKSTLRAELSGLGIGCAAIVVLSVALCVFVSEAGAKSPPKDPAEFTQWSRNPNNVGDFLRLLYIPADRINPPPDHLGTPNKVRVFVGAAAFIRPPITLARVAGFQGIPDVGDQYLGAIRCRPKDLSALSPVLATWPNVIRAILQDYASQKWTCTEPPASEEEEVYCMVKDYADPPVGSVTQALEATLSLGAELFNPGHPETAHMLGSRYGVYPAFSGLGFAVNGSGPATTFDAADSLVNSVVPEYLVKNVSLADAGCRCILVPPYPDRSNDVLDLNYVWRRGGRGECVQVDRLQRAHP